MCPGVFVHTKHILYSKRATVSHNMGVGTLQDLFHTILNKSNLLMHAIELNFVKGGREQAI